MLKWALKSRIERTLLLRAQDACEDAYVVRREQVSPTGSRGTTLGILANIGCETYFCLGAHVAVCVCAPRLAHPTRFRFRALSADSHW